MYYYIKGEKILSTDSFVVVEAGGVGYKIATSAKSLSDLSGIKGVVTMYVQLIVREDSHELVGFTTDDELKMYKHLNSVTGVGPKAAIAILSNATPSDIALSIMTDDVKVLTKAPGVGPKLAKRIILELRDKLSSEEITSGISAGDTVSVQTGTKEEAVMALTVLGYSAIDAKSAVAKLDPQMDLEDMVREALKLLM
ncbi:MAG: Holliday junction branch migration protein RuvA [Clostridia bacterium]|nr:Holliday junction branch migration protein RuvA [Clostridia bacterium]